MFPEKTLRRDVGWRQIELKIYGVEYPERAALFPHTMEVLSRIEGVSTIYFSFLAPHTEIKPHVGDTDAYYRIHLGLEIPGALPECGIEVAGQQKSWREGRCIAFNDIYCHMAWNHTDQERIVLIIDVLRPEFRAEVVFVDAGVRATLYHSRLYEIFLPVVEILPRIVTRLGRPTFHLFSYFYHLIRRWLRLRPQGGKGDCKLNCVTAF